MGSEVSLWKCFKRNMAPFGEFDRHEDKLNLGVPDVSYVLLNGVTTGWIELKHAHNYPARASTVFRIKHFTQEQRFWLRRRGTAGDNCWLFLQVGRDYWLFDWRGAQELGKRPWEETVQFTVAGWVGGVDWQELLDLLVNYRS